MCGIAGCVATDASIAHVEAQLAPSSTAVPTAAACTPPARPCSGPAGSPSSTSSPATRRSPTRTARSASPSTARSTTTASCATSCSARGHELRTAGDTEVIAHLAEELEPVELAAPAATACSRSPSGTTGARRLVLGRDRFGKKPLYYWSGGGRLVFGSEIKAVLAHPAVPRELDPDAIPAYLTFGYVPTPRTFFAGSAACRPATSCVRRGRAGELERYWQPPLPGVERRAEPPSARPTLPGRPCLERRRATGAWSPTCRSARS